MEPAAPIKAIHIWKDFDTYYGVHDQLLCLAEYLDTDAVDYSVAVFHSSEGPIARRFTDAGTTVHDLGILSHQRLSIIGTLARFFTAYKPDVVQTYCLNTNSFGTLAAKKAGVPVVVQTELTRNDQAPTRLKRLRDSIMYPFFAIIRAKADAAVFISESVKHNWVGNSRSSRFHVIYPSFNLAKYERVAVHGTDDGKNDRPPTIGIVARLSEEKRHRDLIDAMPLIQKSVPDIRLLIVGAGSGREELEAQVREKGLGERVVFSGHSENTFHELSMMDVKVLPSRSEGIPISIVEAMAWGLPVVATRVGGIPEAVVDNETGYLVSPYDPPALAERIIDLLRHKDKATAMGAAGKKRAFEVFHPRIFTQRHIDLYRKLLAEKQDARHTFQAA